MLSAGCGRGERVKIQKRVSYGYLATVRLDGSPIVLRVIRGSLQSLGEALSERTPNWPSSPWICRICQTNST